jgi:hypothetical protein
VTLAIRRGLFMNFLLQLAKKVRFRDKNIYLSDNTESVFKKAAAAYGKNFTFLYCVFGAEICYFSKRIARA